MPYTQVNISEKLSSSKKDELKKMFGEHISLIPGKSEAVLMLQINDEQYMSFGGRAGECAMIQVHLFKECPREEKSLFTSKVLNSFSEITGLPIDRIFMNFSEYPEWAANGILK